MEKQKRELWSKEDIEKFIELYPIHTNEYLLETVFKNRTRSSLINAAFIYNVRKNYKTLKLPKKEEAIKKLKEFYDKNGFTPVCTDLNNYNLPSSKTYDRYFGTYRKACLLAGIDINVSIFGKSTADISTNNDICLSKAELYITEFFINRGIKYYKDYKYKNFANVSCEKSCDWFLYNEGIAIEYFGLPEKRSYQKRMQEKREICILNNVPLIELYRKDLKVNKLTNVFSKYFPIK